MVHGENTDGIKSIAVLLATHDTGERCLQINCDIRNGILRIMSGPKS